MTSTNDKRQEFAVAIWRLGITFMLIMQGCQQTRIAKDVIHWGHVTNEAIWTSHKRQIEILTSEADHANE